MPDFSLKWIGGGYDAEWEVLNSKYFGVPQNRERCFIIGHLRGRCTAEVFPVEGTDGENQVQIIAHRDGFRRNMQTYDPDGITETLDTAQGGGRGIYTALNVIADTLYNGVPSIDKGKVYSHEGIVGTLLASQYKEPRKVGIPIAFSNGTIQKEIDVAHCLSAEGSAKEGINTHQSMNRVVIPVITPDRSEKRQNGRRFKEDGDPSFTLTAQDRHGVAIGIDMSANEVGELQEVSHCLNANDQRKVFGANQKRTMGAVLIDGDPETHEGIYVKLSDSCIVYAVWYEKYDCYIAIRKLTPKECFRLQGWTDEYFNRAALVNSESQLYKQAGNGVTVNVIYEIAKKMKG